MLILVFHSCEKDVQKAIVKVDDEVIRLSTFKDQYKEYMANTLQSDNLLTRYSFLNKLVDEKLILKYAKENKLENDSSYVKSINEIYQQMLLNYYFDQKINIDFETTDLEARKFFTWQNQKVHARHLFSRNEQQILELYERLLLNDEWETLALECFQDSVLRFNGGDIGWHEFDDLDPVFAYHLYSLIPGEISEPVRTSDGYSIIELISVETNELLTENAFQLKREKLTNTVKYYKQKQRLINFTDSTSKSLEIDINRDIIEQLHTSIKSIGYKQIENLHEEPMVTYRNGNWNVLKSLERLSNLSKKQLSKIRTPLDLEQSIIGLICREQFLDDAKRQKVYQEISFGETFSFEKNKMMIKHVLDKLDKNHIGNINGLFEEKYSHFKKEILSNTSVIIDSITIKGFTL